jgi:PTS system fructose-specific IIC component
MAFGSQLRAPHGGIWVIALISQPVLFLLAIAVGMAVTAASVVALKTASAKATSKELAYAEAIAA